MISLVACTMLVVNDLNDENGCIASKTCEPCCLWSRSVATIWHYSKTQRWIDWRKASIYLSKSLIIAGSKRPHSYCSSINWIYSGKKSCRAIDIYETSFPTIQVGNYTWYETKKHLKTNNFSPIQGPDRNIDQAALFIQKKFLQRNHNARRVICPHFTTATDTANVQTVFQVVMETVIKENLGNVTLLWCNHFLRQTHTERRWDREIRRRSQYNYLYIFFYYILFRENAIFIYFWEFY